MSCWWGALGWRSFQIVHKFSNFENLISSELIRGKFPIEKEDKRIAMLAKCQPDRFQSRLVAPRFFSTSCGGKETDTVNGTAKLDRIFSDITNSPNHHYGLGTNMNKFCDEFFEHFKIGLTSTLKWKWKWQKNWHKTTDFVTKDHLIDNEQVKKKQEKFVTWLCDKWQWWPQYRRWFSRVLLLFSEEISANKENMKQTCL